jgi:mRNA interferase MazF
MKFGGNRPCLPKLAASEMVTIHSACLASGVPQQIEKPMTSFSQGEVVKVPFPYTDRATRQSRPALVVSTGELQDAHNLIWVAMITSAENRGWTSDVAIANLATAGLPSPSVIRTAKIATLDASDASKLGKISAAQLKQVLAAIGRELGM